MKLFSQTLDYTLNEENNSYSFLFHGIPIQFINSLRRVIMTDVESYAISNINIKRNTSLLHNEFLEHRLSLVPINVNAEMTFSLEAKNEECHFMNVFMDNLETYHDNEYYINKEILFCKLRKGQEISLTFDVVKAKASENIKFRKTNIILFKTTKIVSFDGAEEDMEKIRTLLTDSYDLKLETKLNHNNTVGILDTTKTNLNIPSIVKRKLGLDVSYENYKINNQQVYYFYIECNYLNPKDLFNESIDLLKLRLNNTQFELKKQLNNRYFFNIDNESATIGNPLSYCIDKLDNVDYSFYIKKFPKDKNIEFQIFLSNNDDVQTYLDAGKNSFIEMLDKIRTVS